MTRILLYGNESFKDEVNLLILNATIDFVLFTNRFVEPLYFRWIHRCFSFYSYFHGYNFTIFKDLVFRFRYYFFCIPSTHNSHCVSDCCFYVYCVNVHFHRKIKILKILPTNCLSALGHFVVLVFKELTCLGQICLCFWMSTVVF